MIYGMELEKIASIFAIITLMAVIIQIKLLPRQHIYSYTNLVI